eukprot:6562731-Alexandrium_andersonii.AAC.1
MSERMNLHRRELADAAGSAGAHELAQALSAGTLKHAGTCSSTLKALAQARRKSAGAQMVSLPHGHAE